jgi:hypothetical protein
MIDVGQFDEAKEVDYIPGSALLARTSAISTIGLMDSRFFLYNEDVDWCLRARRSGYRLWYAPKALVWHKEGASTRRVTNTRLYYIHRNRLLLMRKHASRRQLLAAFFPMCARLSAAIAYHSVHDGPLSASTILKAYCDGTTMRISP